MDWGSVPDWLGVALALVGLVVGGGAFASLKAKRDAVPQRLFVTAERVPGLKGIMRVKVRYLADDLDAPVWAQISSSQVYVIPEKALAEPVASTDIKKLKNQQYDYLSIQLRHSGEPDSNEFSGSFLAPWYGFSHAPKLSFEFQQPKGRSRFRVSKQLGPIK